MGRRCAFATWEGPRNAAQLWNDELGCDKREYEALRYGVFDPRDRYIPPFRKVPRGSPNWTEEERLFAEETIRERLDTGVWEELSQEEAAQSRYVSLEFITHQGNGKMRSVAGLSHLAAYWNKRPKKLSTLESFAVLLKERDRMISFDLKGGYHHFRLHPAMRK